MIFLDVGAHEGQTLEEVTKPRYGFERIYAFEPMPEQYEILKRGFGMIDNVTLLSYGLADRTGTMKLHGNNANMGASIYAAKRENDATVTEGRFVAASDFFVQEIASGEQVLLKLNCEGAEVPILDSLVDSGEIWKVHNVMIDFDIRKVPGSEWEEQRIISKLGESGFENYTLCETVMHGATHQIRISAWLDTIEGRTW